MDKTVTTFERNPDSDVMISNEVYLTRFQNDEKQSTLSSREIESHSSRFNKNHIVIGESNNKYNEMNLSNDKSE